jgi:hypothetical protein
MDRDVIVARLALVAGTGLAFLIGLLGPGGAIALADQLPQAVQANGVYALATFVVLGAAAGVVGRGLAGLLALWVGLALWLGLLLATVDSGALGLPGFSGLPFLALVLAIAGLGYLLGRAVDPLWSASSARNASGLETGARQANSRQT